MDSRKILVGEKYLHSKNEMYQVLAIADAHGNRRTAGDLSGALLEISKFMRGRSTRSPPKWITRNTPMSRSVSALLM